MDIWGSTKSLELNKEYRCQIGPLVLWLRRRFDEIQIAVDRVDAETVESEAITFSVVEKKADSSLDWKRWVVGESSDTISIVPVMPDRPVVVRPEVPVKIPEGHEALFFLSIPVWVKIVVNNAKEIVLCQEPSILLSNTWFGDPMNGELCYSLRTKARREIVGAAAKPHRAACPVRILNTTKAQLDVDRFCVHVEHLNTYRGTNRLWTNEVCIKFQGEEAVSKVDYMQKKPKYENVGEIVSKAETVWQKTLFKKSLGTFKSLTGF